MNQESVSTLFRQFFESQLAPKGFVLSTPSTAERTSPGLRQVIRYKFGEHPDFPSFGCHALWSFIHELDDAPPNAALGERGQCVNGGRTPLIELYGVRSEQVVLQRLHMLLATDLPLLDQLDSVEAVLENVERYPASAHNFLGYSIAASFNHAFCLELAGRKAEALERYNAISGSTETDNSMLAIRFRYAADCRFANLLTQLPDGMPSYAPAAPALADDEANDEAIATETLESALARKVLPLDVHPYFVLPGDFTKAINRAYPPSKAFWCDIDADKLVDELKRRSSLYVGVLSVTRDELVNEIRTQQFDEFCAKWLLTLPQDEIPNDVDKVYKMLKKHLKKKGEKTHLYYLELDGHQAVQHIWQTLLQLRAGLE
ncbi:hypothetical protein [Paraburkholderia caribensis]|uniref:hypothetical protein n=1 Tax=Paraburkholderia caribensis TaxID=75105 RepID=UPI00078B8C05|nr:hypothetical protein [Paraburkholderia caribensis]AMV48219.1 hypothetical protein ATN79_46995 [Paraburkholderia caribensis]